MTVRRLFFAIELPKPLPKQIVAWRAAHFKEEDGRPIEAANLHLTLAFLGEVSPQQERTLRQWAGKITQPPFSLTLDGVGHWPNSGVVWCGPIRSPRGLVQLAQLLRAQAARLGIEQSTLPFHPHITLLRGAKKPVSLPAKTDNWQTDISHFSLFESRYSQGRTRYKRIESWPFYLETLRPN